MERPRLRGAEGGVEPARPCPALHWKISKRWGVRADDAAGAWLRDWPEPFARVSGRVRV